MTTRVSGLLHLHVHWANNASNVIDSNVEEDDFLILDKTTDASTNKTRITVRPQSATTATADNNNDDDEMIVELTLTNARFVIKEEGVMTRWISSTFFPPTYRDLDDPSIRLQMTSKDRGIRLPNQIDDQLILVENTSQKVKICVTPNYIVNPSKTGHSSPPIRYPSHCLTIEDPSSYMRFPHIQVELNGPTLLSMNTTSLKVERFALSDPAATVLSLGMTRVQAATSQAIDASQTAASRVVDMSRSVFEGLRIFLPEVGDDCTIS